MTSLAELRMIEEQRIAHERSARLALDAAMRAAKERAERELVEIETQRLADAHAAALAIEQAKASAEREARLRVEAAEAAERARHTAMLDESRLQQEMELRRAEVARTRPTWMLAVTAVAIVAAVVLTVFAVSSMRSAATADEISARAIQEKEAAKRETAEHYKRLTELDAQSAAMDAQIAAASQILVKNEIDANALALQRAKVARLKADKRALDEKRAIAAKKWHDERTDVIKISDECKNAAIGRKGC